MYRAVMNISGWIKSLIMLATSDDIQYNGMIIVKFVIMISESKCWAHNRCNILL